MSWAYASGGFAAGIMDLRLKVVWEFTRSIRVGRSGTGGVVELTDRRKQGLDGINRSVETSSRQGD